MKKKGKGLKFWLVKFINLIQPDSCWGGDGVSLWDQIPWRLPSCTGAEMRF